MIRPMRSRRIAAVTGALLIMLTGCTPGQATPAEVGASSSSVESGPSFTLPCTPEMNRDSCTELLSTITSAAYSSYDELPDPTGEQTVAYNELDRVAQEWDDACWKTTRPLYDDVVCLSKVERIARYALTIDPNLND